MLQHGTSPAGRRSGRLRRLATLVAGVGLLASVSGCGLLSGEGTATWIWRGEKASALVPLGSNWPGHTLVISNEHAVGVQDVSPDALQATTALLQEVARQMSMAFGKASTS